MIYVGHTKFRWRGHVAGAARDRAACATRSAGLALVGEGWDNPPEWTHLLEIKANYYVDREYLKRLARGGDAAGPLPRGHRYDGARASSIPWSIGRCSSASAW